MTFETWIMYVDDLRHRARALKKHVVAYEDRTMSNADRASLESLCQRMNDACPPDTLLTRPSDVMPFEWEDAPWALLHARLVTLYDTTETRTNDSTRWLHELRVSIDDFLEGFDWFNQRIER